MDFFKQQLARARLPPVEQKVFDATNGDPWGPHGTVLGEIARCTASPDERAQVLSVLWRRVAEDKPDQWRCVYKALAVLEYLVANGSDAVVDELCNSSRRLTGLSSFQYKDNDGKDQGINVRHKSATLLELLADRQKIQQVRAKALANRNKYSGVSADEMRSAQGIVRPVEQSSEDDEFRIRDTSGPRQPDADSTFTPKFQVKMSSAPRAAPGPAPKLQMNLPPPPPRLVPPVPPPKPASTTFPAAPRPVPADAFGLAALSAPPAPQTAPLADAFGLAALSAPPAPQAAPLAALAYAAQLSQPPAAAAPNLLDDLLGAPVAATQFAPAVGPPPASAPGFSGYTAFTAPGGAPAAAAAGPFDLLSSPATLPAAGAGGYGMPSIPPTAAPPAAAARVDPFLSFPPPPVVQQQPVAPVGAGAPMARSSGGMTMGTPSQSRKPATLDEALNASLNLLS